MSAVPAFHPHPSLPGWRWLAALGLLVALAGGAAPASAESLRCAAGIAAEGDSKLSLMAKCGQPVLTDTYCAPLYQHPHVYPVPEPYASRILRLNSLAPDIKQAILDGRQPKSLRVQDMMSGCSEIWDDQRIKFNFPPKD